MRARNRNKGKTIMIWNRKTSRMGTLAGLLLAANGLFASTVTYDFIGTPFTSDITAPYTTSDRVTATITFADALPASMALQAVTPLSLIMTDGHQVFDYSDPTLQFKVTEFGTDVSGAITTWQVFLQGPIIFLPGGTNTANLVFTRNNGSAVSFGHFYDPSRGPGYIAGARAFDPGAWTDVTAGVPEPGASILMLLGASMVLVARRLRPTWRQLRTE